MEFSSLLFLFLFLPIFLLFFFLLKKEAHNSFLVMVSLFFYAWGEGKYIIILLVSILINYVLALTIDRRQSKKTAKLLFILGLAFNVGLLVVFKYANFIAANLNISISKSPIHLPIGISFYTFLAISYLVDVYRKTQPAAKNPVDFALYISLFPKLITGPITLYHDFAAQISQKRELALDDFSEGVKRFILGLGKKVLIADTLAKTANQVFDIPAAQQTAGLAWLGIICYTLQIYFDFSGYSDMAIGLGRMLGFKIPENFNYPYISKNIKEFWTRWHITLANWLRDYLFLPMAYAVSRKIKKDRVLKIKAEGWAYYIATFFTFLLCGIWHGANWTFFVWGGYYGILLVIEQAGMRKFLKKKLPSPLRLLFCQLLVIIGWVFFRSPDLGYAFTYLSSMFGFGTGDGLVHYPALYFNMEVLFFISIGIVGSFPLFPKLKARYEKKKGRGWLWGYSILSTLYLTFVLLASTMVLASGTYTPFIYFRF
ncbi:MAG: MBOAT family protein [Candidatus Aminicenantes bacterium]|nr:MBOAT family protein [Candidatus Aminicenantes bacterium]